MYFAPFSDLGHVAMAWSNFAIDEPDLQYMNIDQIRLNMNKYVLSYIKQTF